MRLAKYLLITLVKQSERKYHAIYYIYIHSADSYIFIKSYFINVLIASSHTHESYKLI